MGVTSAWKKETKKKRAVEGESDDPAVKKQKANAPAVASTPSVIELDSTAELSAPTRDLPGDRTPGEEVLAHGEMGGPSVPSGPSESRKGSSLDDVSFSESVFSWAGKRADWSHLSEETAEMIAKEARNFCL